MPKTQARIAAGAVAIFAAVLAGFALKPDSRAPTATLAARNPAVEVKTIVIRRTVHVTRHPRIVRRPGGTPGVAGAATRRGAHGSYLAAAHTGASGHHASSGTTSSAAGTSATTRTSGSHAAGAGSGASTGHSSAPVATRTSGSHAGTSGGGSSSAAKPVSTRTSGGSSSAGSGSAAKPVTTKASGGSGGGEKEHGDGGGD